MNYTSQQHIQNICLNILKTMEIHGEVWYWNNHRYPTYPGHDNNADSEYVLELCHLGILQKILQRSTPVSILENPMGKRGKEGSRTITIVHKPDVIKQFAANPPSMRELRAMPRGMGASLPKRQELSVDQCLNLMILALKRSSKQPEDKLRVIHKISGMK